MIFRLAVLQQKIFTDTDDLLLYLKSNDAVEHINVNSTMGRHSGAFAKSQSAEHTLISGGNRGKALIICSRHEREKWDIEYRHAHYVLENQFGLQVEVYSLP